MPPTPAAVETRPITAGETPSCTIRRIATKNIAFTSRFASALQTAGRAEVRPAQDEADALGHVVVRLARRSLAVRCGEVGPQAAQHDPVDGEGDGVEGERQPAGDGEQDAAERAADQGGDVLTGLALAERGRQLVGADDRADRGDLGRGRRCRSRSRSAGRPPRGGGSSARRARRPIASEAYRTTPAPLAVRMSSRRSTRSARTPAGSRAPHMPSRKAASTTAAQRAEPLRA